MNRYQKALMLKKHAKHHSAKHINLMKALINKGMTFDEAHKTAMKQVGK
jgi:hypothetical protein|tara:strand:- start:87 stop:233 length:147 start_codon:yes stop_codon:yes gene_type:complete